MADRVPPDYSDGPPASRQIAQARCQHARGEHSQDPRDHSVSGHSESGFFPEQATLIDPSGVRGIISIEMPCATMNATQVSSLAKIPILVMFGDHLDTPGGGNWVTSFDGCQKFVQQVKDAGGDAEMMHLPKMGIRGNSHMLMQDRNNLQLADLILDWIDKHVEKKSAPRR